MQDVQYISVYEMLTFVRNPSGYPALLKVGQKLADTKGIKSLNVEFRVLDPGFCCLTPGWRVFLDELGKFIVEQVYHEVQSYDDCSCLNEYYKKIPFPSSLLTRILTGMGSLLKARLLHNIYQAQVQHEYANVVVVCAGYAHNWRIEEKLPKLGYRRIERDGA